MEGKILFLSLSAILSDKSSIPEIMPSFSTPINIEPEWIFKNATDSFSKSLLFDLLIQILLFLHISYEHRLYNNHYLNSITIKLFMHFNNLLF